MSTLSFLYTQRIFSPIFITDIILWNRILGSVGDGANSSGKSSLIQNNIGETICTCITPVLTLRTCIKLSRTFPWPMNNPQSPRNSSESTRSTPENPTLTNPGEFGGDHRVDLYLNLQRKKQFQHDTFYPPDFCVKHWWLWTKYHCEFVSD